MFKTYDSAQAAYVEHSPKNHDSLQGAWVESPSAKTYDATEKAWVERLYTDYFSLINDGYATKLQSGDILEVSKSGFVFNTFSTGLLRKIKFELPYKFTYGDVIEFDVVTNALGEVNVGREFNLSGGNTIMGGVTTIDGAYNQHVTATITASAPDTYEGQTVTSSYITVYSTIAADEATGETYTELRNFKINGKKYGFTE